MAFLDNSGDIILDAVLTEAGRRRMAQGNFRITKFALGDDEIDYSLYNKNHPSGSAYYDLEILQTPIFEAFTQVNAGINYGLLPSTATDLLYLPVMKINELSQVAGGTGKTQAIASSGSSGLFLIADNAGDTGTGTSSISGLLSNNSISYIDGASPSNFVLLEGGLDTGTGATPDGTDANRQSFLVANGLVDRRLITFFDNRFIASIKGLSAESSYNNLGSSNTLQANLTLRDSTRTNIQSGLENYSAATVNAVKNGIVYTSSPETEADLSTINGPRSIVAAVAPVIKSGLNAEYSLYGGTTTLGGKSLKFIDTTVYVQGSSSPAQIQIPVRIIRLA